MALLVSVMAMLMMLALGAGVTLTTMTETTIAANHRDRIQALYAAEAGIDLAVSRLRTTTDWRTAAAANGMAFLQGRLTDLLQSNVVDGRIDVAVLVSPDPNGNEDVLLLQSSAGAPGGIRRSVQVTIRRGPTRDDGAARTIETLSWRER